MQDKNAGTLGKLSPQTQSLFERSDKEVLTACAPKCRRYPGGAEAVGVGLDHGRTARMRARFGGELSPVGDNGAQVDGERSGSDDAGLLKQVRSTDARALCVKLASLFFEF